MSALITGGTGFIGTELARFLHGEGVEVTVTSRTGRGAPEHPVVKGTRVEAMDVRDPLAVDRVLEAVRPDVVYHLAGQPDVSPSWDDPETTFVTNLLGTLHLLESIRRHRPSTRFAFAGSGTEYGNAEVVPTPESSPLRPLSPYASSKAGADLLSYQYFATYEVPVFRYRIFGTTGPGRKADSVNDFASRIAAIERQASPRTLRVGNLDKDRDVTDRRDAVRAMALVVDRAAPGEAYNIGSGVRRTVRKTLETLVSLSAVPVQVEVDPSLVRRVDEPVHLADVSRLRALGWTPRIPFEQTLSDTLEFWRSRR